MRLFKPLLVAIDGPAGAGKSTVARRVADKLGYLYIDTGAMYRAATWLVLENKVNHEDAEAVVKLVTAATIELKTGVGITSVFVNGRDVTEAIRLPAVTHLVSPVSAIPALRQHLVEKQKLMAARGGIVMDGRDIGTVVLPNADIKIFLTASPEVRAQRRIKDLAAMGQQADAATVLQEINYRDRLDSTRETGALRQAPDAHLVDTTGLTVDEVVAYIMDFCCQC